MEDEKTYKIVRMYFEGWPTEVIERGLTLTEAQTHCRDPETSSSTAVLPVNASRTKRRGKWFDGYEEEK